MIETDASRARAKRSPLRRAVLAAGDALVTSFHYLLLFAIGAATVWATASAFLHMIEARSVSVEDLLLLFIYLEIGAMVGIYFRTSRMPVRFVLYVAITALTRHMIGLETDHGPPGWGELILAGAITLLAFAVLVLRFGSFRYPSENRSGEPAVHTDLNDPGRNAPGD